MYLIQNILLGRWNLENIKIFLWSKLKIRGPWGNRTHGPKFLSPNIKGSRPSQTWASTWRAHELQRDQAPTGSTYSLALLKPTPVLIKYLHMDEAASILCKEINVLLALLEKPHRFWSLVFLHWKVKNCKRSLWGWQRVFQLNHS